MMKAIEAGYSPSVLLNVLNEEGKISRSHGIPKKILQAQAEAAGLSIHLIESSWKDYEANFIGALKDLARRYNVSHAVFGDIDLQAHKDWEVKVCSNAGLAAILPLWQQDRKQLVLQMLNSGIETMIVSCNEVMGEKYLGKVLTEDLVNELETLGIDACGENGEFHTLVLNCPLFKSSIKVEVKDKVKHENYWFCTLVL